MQKDLNDSDNHDGVITHLESDILECEIMWGLGIITTNKRSGGDGILAGLFQILKDDAVKVLHSICQQILKTQQWSEERKGQFSFQSQRRAVPRNSNYRTIALISHASKVMSKILQARLQEYMNWRISKCTG